MSSDKFTVSPKSSTDCASFRLATLTPHDALKSPPVGITYALVIIIVFNLKLLVISYLRGYSFLESSDCLF